MDAYYTTMGTEPQNTEAVLAKLIEGLEHNGGLSETEHRRLILLAITGLYYIVMPLPTKVRRLESKNILIWIERNPKISAFLAMLAIILSMFVHQIGTWIVSCLEVLTKLKF